MRSEPVVTQSEIPVPQYAECTGEKLVEHVRIAVLRVEILNSNIPNRKQPKYRNAQGKATPTGHSFNNKIVVERADTRTSTKSLGSPVPIFDLADYTSIIVLTTLCFFNVALIRKSSQSE